jgi:hypothetical protein
MTQSQVILASKYSITVIDDGSVHDNLTTSSVPEWTGQGIMADQ